jgi:hypothetical protein
MDLNPDSGSRLNREIKFFLHDCSVEWPLTPESLDVIFTSNFLELLQCLIDLGHRQCS